MLHAHCSAASSVRTQAATAAASPLRRMMRRKLKRRWAGVIRSSHASSKAEKWDKWDALALTAEESSGSDAVLCMVLKCSAALL